MEFEKVRDIIVATLGCDAEAVTPTASLAEMCIRDRCYFGCGGPG